MSNYNFSDAFREVLIAARRCAAEYGSGYVEVPHIAIAALESPSREFRSYVERLGIEPQNIASELRSSLGPGLERSPSDAVETPTSTVRSWVAELRLILGLSRQEEERELPYSAAAKAALEGAMRISSNYRHEVVGADHLLAAVSTRIRVLSDAIAASGVNREQSLALLEDHRSAPPHAS